MPGLRHFEHALHLRYGRSFAAPSHFSASLGSSGLLLPTVRIQYLFECFPFVFRRVKSVGKQQPP